MFSPAIYITSKPWASRTRKEEKKSLCPFCLVDQEPRCTPFDFSPSTSIGLSLRSSFLILALICQMLLFITCTSALEQNPSLLLNITTKENDMRRKSESPSPFLSTFSPSFEHKKVNSSEEAMDQSERDLVFLQQHVTQDHEEGSKVLSRSKRGVFQLAGMISCVTECDPLAYKGYGCYCGYGGGGRAVNGIDR